MDKFVGKRLDGRYEIREILGVGGMAVVYKAYDNQENRTVAIKILKEEFVSNEEFVRRFKNESKAIAMLSHQNIVKVFDVSFGDLIQYIVMEYIDGITLKEFIERQGSLSWKDSVHFTLQILKALQHAHDKGIVHRDVKPQNIMVLPDGTIKVADFGIARFARSEQRTMTDKAIGSVHYISPEQARGEKTDEKADIYSVGVMLYEMITGTLPFEADSAVSVAIMQLQREPKLPTEINGSIPLGLEQITMHAMQKNVEKRYQSAAEMLCDIDKFRKDPAITFAYSYFIDNAPTKFVSGDATANGKEVKAVYKEEKEKNTIIPILAGIAVTLVIAIIVLAIIFIPKLFSETGSEIECPNFVGMTYEQLKENEEYNELYDFVIEWANNSDYENGYIFEQSHTAGTKMKKDAKITLYISMGQATKKVPDVYSKTESSAVSELKSNGFEVAIEEIASEEIDVGLVVKTEPARTTVVEEGAKITVFISTGKPIKNVKIPSVVSRKSEDAKKELESLGLVVVEKDEDMKVNDTYYPKGYVMSQAPVAGAKEVPVGTEVIIYVSTGEYVYDVNVSLPIDYLYDAATVSLWEDATLVAESKKMNINEMGQYLFKDVKSSNITEGNRTETYTVKFSSNNANYEDYMKIKVDCKTGTVSVISRYESYSKKDFSSSSSQNSVSTDVSSSVDSESSAVSSQGDNGLLGW
ncbi:MAG: Stk1 family PASTA domain-containing Ser/Thr kinase [Clostridia bacterium]|nr:Stk1 family PASTA domain-containing Ser/Thr kinase [Clostridia bacterium]